MYIGREGVWSQRSRILWKELKDQKFMKSECGVLAMHHSINDARFACFSRRLGLQDCVEHVGRDVLVIFGAKEVLGWFVRHEDL
jgi:hypothetical protein